MHRIESSAKNSEPHRAPLRLPAADWHKMHQTQFPREAYRSRSTWPLTIGSATRSYRLHDPRPTQPVRTQSRPVGRGTMRANSSWPRSCSSPGRRSRSAIWSRPMRDNRPRPARCAPLGRGDRLAGGYLVRLTNRPAGMRRLKSIESIVDAARCSSPAMVRLTAWIAEHYLCEWGQVLEAVVPAGVRDQAGTRLTTLLSCPPKSPRAYRAEACPTKADANPGRAAAGPIRHPPPRRFGRLHGRADHAHCHNKGLIAAEDAPRRSHEQPPNRAAQTAEAHSRLNADQRRALDAILAALQSGRHETILVARHHRQRQDRGLHPGDRGGGALRPAGDRAGARDQSHAANRRPLSRPLRQGGRAAQPPERRRAAPALGADRRRRRVGGRRRRAAPSSPRRRTWA